MVSYKELSLFVKRYFASKNGGLSSIMIGCFHPMSNRGLDRGNRRSFLTGMMYVYHNFRILDYRKIESFSKYEKPNEPE